MMNLVFLGGHGTSVDGSLSAPTPFEQFHFQAHTLVFKDFTLILMTSGGPPAWADAETF